MGSFLGLPPLLMLVITLAVIAYVIYHIASTGTVQPLAVLALILAGLGLARSVYRIYAQRKAQVSEDD